MPTYDYECQACRAALEAEQSIKDAPLVKCPACGKDELKRLIGGKTGFVLNGKGWFKTGGY